MSEDALQALGKASDDRLILLRDRFGLLSPETAWAVLQRLTWIHQTGEAVTLMNQAVDDVLETPRPVTADSGVTQLTQLFVNGTIVFSDTTDEINKLVVKVDGKVLVQHSNEPQFERCANGIHIVPVGYSGPCIYCLHTERTDDRLNR